MIYFLLFLLCAQAEPPPPQEKPPPDVQERLEDQEDQIKGLERRIQELEKRQARTVSANPQTVLNPSLTVVGDFLWRFDDQRVYVDDNPANERIDDTANLREMELDLRAAVDPFVDAVGILAVGSEVPGEYEVDVEEFYALVKALPLPGWEEPPLGTQLKVGRFRAEWGFNNKCHLHDLPQSDRPVVIQEFLGPEGHVANGVSFTSFLPSPGDTALQLTGQVLQGGGVGVAPDADRLAFLANLNLFVPLADEHSFNMSLVGFCGADDPDDESRVAGLDALYKWKPSRQGEYTSLVMGGQVFCAEHDFVGGRTRPWGGSLFAQFQATARLYVGVRGDETEWLEDDGLLTRQVSPYVTWYSSEFFRVRGTYQHTWSDDPVIDGLDSFFLEMVVVFGAHPPEPFWVNK